jgi:hypothetical protein
LSGVAEKTSEILRFAQNDKMLKKRIEESSRRAYLPLTMIRIISTALIAAAMLTASSAFAGDHACCAKGAANAQATACVNLASLNLTPDQKTKIEAWQTECMKATCTKESRQTFLSRAKGILSPEQFAELKAQCNRTRMSKKSEA